MIAKILAHLERTARDQFQPELPLGARAVRVGNAVGARRGRFAGAVCGGKAGRGRGFRGKTAVRLPVWPPNGRVLGWRRQARFRHEARSAK